MARESTEETVERMARECVGNQLRMLSRVMTGIYEEELRPLKLKVSQMVILVVTAKNRQVRAVELSRELHMDTSTLSRNLERMRARGWLEQAPGEDGRSRPFHLTARGEKLLRDAIRAWERAQAKALGVVGPEGALALRRISERVKEGAPVP
jgi:DNA-binding MarR family transcriptional regulator